MTDNFNSIHSSAAVMDAAPQIDIDSTNRLLQGRSAMERIEWAAEVFGERLFALTSAGFDSTLTLEHVAQSGRNIPIIHINTGFLPPETLQFCEELQSRYSMLPWHEYGPSSKEVDSILANDLWAHDIQKYRRITKLAPLSRAIQEQHVQALITGIRADQTAHRANLEVVRYGKDGELRIHPFIDWPADKVNEFIVSHKLPRHPLYGVLPALDDIPFLGDHKMECGLHL